jgi:Tfp pilus assembly protein PilW
MQQGVLGGLAVVAVVAALVLFGPGSGDGKKKGVDASATSTTTVVEETTTTVVEETTTTFDLVPQTTTTTARRPTTTTTAAPQPVVTAAGAVLKAPATPTTRTISGDDCASLAASSSDEVSCGFAQAKGGVRLAYVIEGTTAGKHARRAYVFTPSGAPGVWKSVLEAVDADGSKWTAVKAVVVDISGDKADEIAFGFRGTGSGSLALDVVEGPGTVTAHRDLAKGAARVSTGQLDTWSASAASTGQYDHDVIRWVDGAWRMLLRNQSAAADVPPSQL